MVDASIELSLRVLQQLDIDQLVDIKGSDIVVQLRCELHEIESKGLTVLNLLDYLRLNIVLGSYEFDTYSMCDIIIVADKFWYSKLKDISYLVPAIRFESNNRIKFESKILWEEDKLHSSWVLKAVKLYLTEKLKEKTKESSNIDLDSYTSILEKILLMEENDDSIFKIKGDQVILNESLFEIGESVAVLSLRGLYDNYCNKES